MFSRRSVQLALQTAAWLARQPNGAVHSVRNISSSVDASATYMAKVINTMTRAGLLRSVRGPGGGVALARPAPEVRLWEIVALFTHPREFETCFLSQERCSELYPCPLHEDWLAIRRRLLEKLQRKTLGQFAAETRPAPARLQPQPEESFPLPARAGE